MASVVEILRRGEGEGKIKGENLMERERRERGGERNGERETERESVHTYIHTCIYVTHAVLISTNLGGRAVQKLMLFF